MSENDMIAAAREGDRARLEALLDDGAPVDAEDEQGWTPLAWAAGQGHGSAVRLLLDRGADVTHTGRDLRTPLMIARAAGRGEVAALLTEAEQALGVWQDPRKTRPYCKAYYLRDLARFDDWPAEVEVDAGDDGGDGPSEPVVYVHQDLTVTRSMWHGEDIVFDRVDEAWETFCRDQLEFAVPEDLL